MVDWVILINLNLHTTPRCELRYNNRVRNLPENIRVGFASEAVVVCMKICSGNNESQVSGLRIVNFLNIFKEMDKRQRNQTLTGLVHVLDRSRTAARCL